MSSVLTMPASDQVAIALLSWGPSQIAGIPLIGYSFVKGVFGAIKNTFDPNCIHASRNSDFCSRNLKDIAEQKKLLKTLKNQENTNDFAQRLQKIVDNTNTIQMISNIQIKTGQRLLDVPVAKSPHLRSDCLNPPNAAFIGTIDNPLSQEDRIKLVISELDKILNKTQTALTDKKTFFDATCWSPQKDFSSAAFYGIAMIPFVGTLLASHFIPSFWDN